MGLLVSLPLFLVLGVSVLRAFGRIMNPPPFYTEFQGALDILESRMNWVQTKDGLRIYITGLLTNRSAVAWQSPEFECRFFGTNGAMIDAANARAFLTIHPNDDSAFRVAVVPGCATNDYRSFKVSVSTARNSRAPF